MNVRRPGSKIIRYVIIVLAVMGLSQIAQGGWIFLKAQIAQVLLQRAWAHTLNGEHQVKPWPWADTWPVARMVAPRHGADLIILAGGSGRTLAFGPAHIAGTALPGESGTTVLSAHRDTHFRFLARLAVGDEIVIYRAQASTVRYRVRSSEVVDARIARIVHDDAHSTLILVTCYPFNSVIPGGPSRYVVTADLAAQ